MNLKYFTLFMIVTTSTLNCSEQAEQSKELRPFPACMRLPENFPTGSMISKSEEFKNFWKKFDNNKKEYINCTYAQSNILMLQLVAIAAISALSFPYFFDFYTSENYANPHSTLTLLACAQRIYAMRKFQNQNHARIIEACAHASSPQHLEILQKYYEKNPDSHSQTFLNKVVKQKISKNKE
jgi:hypothetical protein